MRRAAVLLLAPLFGVVSARYPPAAAAAGLSPLWLFLLPLLAGLRATPGRAALVGWCFGLVADLLSVEPLGLNAFLFAGAALTLARLRTYLFSDHAVTQGVVAFGLTLLVLLVCLIRLEVAADAFGLSAQLPAVFLCSLTTGILFPFLVVIEKRVDLLRDLRRGAGSVRA